MIGPRRRRELARLLVKCWRSRGETVPDLARLTGYAVPTIAALPAGRQCCGPELWDAMQTAWLERFGLPFDPTEVPGKIRPGPAGVRWRVRDDLRCWAICADGRRCEQKSGCGTRHRFCAAHAMAERVGGSVNLGMVEQCGD